MKRLILKLIESLLLSLFFVMPSLGESNIPTGDRMIEKNSTIAPFTLNDQFGEEHSITQMPKLLICSFGKESGKLISSYFNQQSNNYLESNNIKLMADVSGVPSLLRKTIIFPKMKKYGFKILVSTESSFMKQFPTQEDKLTVLKLDNGTVTDILFVDDEMALKEVIEKD
jgi:histidinol phosphatase-like PHP family hydrolase